MQTHHTLQLLNRDLDLRLSPAAHTALAARTAPLVVEMELYFSCLIRKRVRFLETAHPGAFCATLNEHLTVCFRPVMTRHCSVSEVEGQPELETFPIQRPEAFMPKWLTLDFRRGTWSGEYSF
jgi:hypothetical protein